MALASGTRLGPYEITAPLGAGGMGEVYRAKDTKLKRDVALKVLPADVANDRERLARFRREAEVLASLNHPHIAHIHGLEESNGTIALVMELVEGEDLEQKIRHGSKMTAEGSNSLPSAMSHQPSGGLPMDEALDIARQIADALEAAHERGIIHRDLKPANVKVRDDGTVKVLDFGLAKAVESGGSTADLMHSPTMTSPAMTAMGMILGTAAYMAPEQAKGKVVDRRADVWAFGCVLFEMLTGRRAFPGEDVTDTLAAIVRADPDWSALPAATAPSIHRLLRRCLEKDRTKRLDSVAAARLEIDEALAAKDAGVAPVGRPAEPRWRRALPWGIAALALLVAAAAGARAMRRPVEVPSIRMSIALPAGHRVTSGPIITRDGRRIAFASGSGTAQPKLYTRTIDSFDLRELPGTDGAGRPFFSPDGRWIGFFAKGKLFTLDLEGGAPTALADAPSHGGGTWAEDGTIVFVPTWNGGLYRIKASGGTEEPIIRPDPAKKEYAYASPLFLPGGHQLLFASWGATFGIDRLTLPDRNREVVVPTFWTSPVYAGSGHLLVGNNEGGIQALTYPTSSTAQPPTVLTHVDWDGGSGDGAMKFAVSDGGTLVYAPADITQRSLVMVDETGRADPVPGESQPYMSVALSRDGRQAAAEQNGAIWIVDLERGGRTPLAPQRAGSQTGAAWAPDGSRVFFGSNVDGNWEIYSAKAGQPAPMEATLRKEFDQFPMSVASDGTVLFMETRPGTGNDLWLLAPGATPTVWLATPAEETSANFSRDGRLIAYASNASGRSEVYVEPRDRSSGRVQISTNGGSEPAWSPAGDRIFYREGNALMVAEVRVTSSLSASAPRRLFDRGWELPAGTGFGVMPDGKRFLMIRFAPAAIPTRLDVVFNWFDDLKKRAPRN